MSFSSEVKEELSKLPCGKEHCVNAEIVAIITMCGGIHVSAFDNYSIKINTENIAVARRLSILLYKNFKVKPEILIRVSKNEYKTYIVVIKNNIVTQEILRLIEKDDYSKTCCQRAYLRGVFLAAGSITDPNKSYHLEIVCNLREKTLKIQQILQKFDIESKKVARGNRFVVYIKEGSLIVDTLNVCGAHNCLMKLENIRILKDVRNNLNRQVNCETANISKVVKTAVRQIEDINLIKDKRGLDSLPDTLYEVALVRLSNPDASLVELGKALENPIGKSGVNHRLRKISEIADSLRQN